MSRLRRKVFQMKKIAVASEGSRVSDHFGLCKDFMIYSVDGARINHVEMIANPGHKPCELPEFVETTGATTLITGSMGKAAAENFHRMGIEVILGVKGESEQVVQTYLKGELESTGNLCDSWICEFFEN